MAGANLVRRNFPPPSLSRLTPTPHPPPRLSGGRREGEESSNVGIERTDLPAIVRVRV